MSKKVLSGKEVFNKMVKGLDTAADAVARTLGPKGRNVYLYSADPMQTKTTNDGVTIASRIILKDPEEDAGAFVIRNVSEKTLDDCGDGTTTTSILTQAIIHECLKRPENAMEIRESLKEAGDKVVKLLAKKTVPLKKEDIEKVALISAEDQKLAKLITEVINKLGEKAVINVEDSKTMETNYEIMSGYEANVGFLSNMFINDKKSSKAIYEDVPVLCSEKKISSVADIAPLFNLFKANGIGSCVIVAQDIDDSMVGMLAANKMMGNFNSLVIRATGLLLNDIAGVVGAKLISDSTGISFQNFAIDSLGRAKKVVSDANKTLFIGDEKSTKEYADKLEAQTESEPNLYTQKTMVDRLGKLKGNIAVLHISAPTDSERGYLKDKAEDAVKATICALEEGIVEGGGMALWRIAQEIKGKSIGEQILKRALTAPLRMIINNAGEDYTEIVMGLPEGMGYNAKNGYCSYLIADGVIDPAKVERCAVTNAVSAASQFITIETLVTDEKETGNN